MPDDLSPQFAAARDFFEAFGWTVATSDSLEADDLLGTYALREAEAGGKALLLTGDRDMYQCAGERVTVLYVRTGGGKGRGGGWPGRGARALRRSTPSRCRTSSPCAATPPTACPAPRVSARRPRPTCCAAMAASRRSSITRSASSAPSCARALIDGHEELLAFKDIATLRDAGVERPRDRPTDWAGAAAAAREHGMNRLAERLEANAGAD